MCGGLALWPVFERNSAISLLLAGLLGGVALLTAWSWLFGATSAAPCRWLLAAYAAALVLAVAAIPLVLNPWVVLFRRRVGAGLWEVVLLGRGSGWWPSARSTVVDKGEMATAIVGTVFLLYNAEVRRAQAVVAAGCCLRCATCAVSAPPPSTSPGRPAGA